MREGGLGGPAGEGRMVWGRLGVWALCVVFGDGGMDGLLVVRCAR